jgi:hypothetical protein
MISLHDLSEHTKLVIDRASYGLAAVSGAVSYTSLMDGLNLAAVIIAILSGLVSLGWGLCRVRDRIKYGPSVKSD